MYFDDKTMLLGLLFGAEILLGLLVCLLGDKIEFTRLEVALESVEFT